MARIIYVTHSYAPQDRKFLQKLSEVHEVWFVPWTQSSPSESRPVPDGVQRLPALNNGHEAKLIKWARSVKRLREYVAKVRPDVIQAGPLQTGTFVAVLSGFRPLIAMSWGYDVLSLGRRTALMRWIGRFTLTRAKYVVVDCDAARERVLSMAPLKAEQVICFPYGIDLDTFHPAVSRLQLRAKLGWEKNRVLIMTRRFEPIHGTMIFLEAMIDVFRKCPDTRVLMVGDGSLRPQVDAFIENHGLREKFYLPGQVPEAILADYYNEADLYVSATHSDGASISLLQAMGCGLPVVVAGEDGNLEWVQHGRNGWLYPAGDGRALAAAIVEGLNDQPSRMRMGRANSALASERANWDTNVQKLLTAYDQIVDPESKFADKPPSYEPSTL
ncbi:MAG: glycosyltransferase family 4 protein [Bryobacteraceae bacterium]